jgi:hypothetical protein
METRTDQLGLRHGNRRKLAVIFGQSTRRSFAKPHRHPLPMNRRTGILPVSISFACKFSAVHGFNTRIVSGNSLLSTVVTLNPQPPTLDHSEVPTLAEPCHQGVYPSPSQLSTNNPQLLAAQRPSCPIVPDRRVGGTTTGTFKIVISTDFHII